MAGYLGTKHSARRQQQRAVMWSPHQARWLGPRHGSPHQSNSKSPEHLFPDTRHSRVGSRVVAWVIRHCTLTANHDFDVPIIFFARTNVGSQKTSAASVLPIVSPRSVTNHPRSYTATVPATNCCSWWLDSKIYVTLSSQLAIDLENVRICGVPRQGHARLP